MAVADDTTRRRLTSPATPPTLTLHRHPSPQSTTVSPPSSSNDFELVSLKPASYTSLRDILPSTAGVQSPKAPSFATGGNSSCGISIRNRLVQQAAWAYLQPMSTSPDSGGATVFHRLWTRFSCTVLRLVTQAVDCLLRCTQLRTTGSRL